MKPIRSIIEEQIHDDEVVHLLGLINRNAKFNPGTAVKLSSVATLAKVLSTFDEGSHDYANAHDGFIHGLYDLHHHVMTSEDKYHPNAMGDPHSAASAMFHTARRNIKPWVDSGKYGPQGRVDYRMTAMHLQDAADQLDLAHYVAQNAHGSFDQKLRHMDTNPREEIPAIVWDKWYQGNDWKRNKQ